MKFQEQYLVCFLLAAASCLALVARADEAVKVTVTNNAATTTVAPGLGGVAATATAAAAIKVVDATTNKDSPAPATERPAAMNPSGPATGAPAAALLGASKLPAAVLDAIVGHAAGGGAATTAKPAADAPAPPQPSPSGAPASSLASVGAATVDEKLEQYFEPVCVAVKGNKLSPKQLFKLQSQLKQFVERTDGKMSLCFMSQYSIDPNLTPVTKDQLATICSSKTLASDAKGSFKQFKDCSAHNWDSNLDKEIDRIIEARIQFTKNHSHAANETAATLGHSHDDDDEITMIGDVVKNVLDGNKEALDRPGIKVIDVSGPAAAAAVANKLANDKLASTPAPLAGLLMPNKKLFNDPNTVVVFVDDSTTKGPSTVAPKVAAVPSTSTKPAQIEVSVHTDSKAANSASTTVAPVKGAGVGVEIKTGLGDIIVSATTSAPVDQTKPPAVENSKLNVTVSSLVSAAFGQANTTPGPSTAAPATTGTPPSSKAPAAVTTTTTTSKSPKPLESLKEMLKRQEKEKLELEAKLKVEREKIMKQLQKKQDEIDAQNAIKSLQLQRATGGHSGSHADAKLHQIEHERQMSIDPVGHTIKHQQYELIKQQKSGNFPAISG